MVKVNFKSWTHNLVNKQLQLTYCPIYISQNKENQAIKFRQLIEYTKRNIFFKNYAENETERLIVPNLFFVF